MGQEIAHNCSQSPLFGFTTNGLDKSFLSISQISHKARLLLWCRCGQICCLIVKAILGGCWVVILPCPTALTPSVWGHSASTIWRQSLVLRAVGIKETCNCKLIKTHSFCVVVGFFFCPKIGKKKALSSKNVNLNVLNIAMFHGWWNG